MANVANARKIRVLTLSVGMLVGFSAVSAWAVQAPVSLPPIHERQCVATGDVPAGSVRKVTVKWNRPFPTTSYTVIGSVSDSTDGDSIELSHVVAPYGPDTVAAVVSNHDAGAAHSGILCLDASRE
jgi:hypothetical protein